MSISVDKKLDGLVNYLVHRYPGQLLTRTKLVKLAFLADAKAQEDLGSKISRTNYINYHYGPYSDDVIEMAERLDGESLREKIGQASMGEFYDYRPEGDLPEIDLSDEERRLIQFVLDEYGTLDTEDLVDRVYEEFDIPDKPKYSTLL